MAIVTLSDMKSHLGIVDDTDDALISAKIDAAQAWLEQMLGYDIATEFAAPLVVPFDLVEAVKQVAAHFYENREASLVGLAAVETPFGVWDIVANRRNYSWADA